MKNKILVSIVSEQTLPNYLFIKEFQKEIDVFLFISTQEMEQKNKTTLIYETAGIVKNNIRKILINEDELYLVKNKLHKLGWQNKNNEYFVNITGGTKLMSNAVYEYFKQYNSRFFYLPIGKNIYKEVYDNKKAESFSIKYNISVKEYLKIYGIRFEKEDNIYTEEQCNELLKDVRATQYDINKFPKNKIKKFNLSHLNKQIHTKWFEEFLYYKIKKILNLNKDKIATGIKLFEIKNEKEHKNYNNDNELDLFFIYKNNPYLIEAKFSVGKNINATVLNNYIFKLSSINKRFGLRAKATLMTLADFNVRSVTFKENLNIRSKIANVYFPFDRNNLLNDKVFKISLKQFLK